MHDGHVMDFSQGVSSNSRKLIALLVFLLLLTVVSTAVLAVLYGMEVQKSSKESCDASTISGDHDDPPDDVDLSACDDVTIVGAGIAGSYAAWRLRNQDKKITIYEYSDRIGGRCHTIKFPGIPDVNIELGAMRFEPLDHLLVNQTVHELGLEVQDFPVGSDYHPDSLLYLRGQHMRYKDLENIRVPYQLEDYMRIDFDRLNWKIFANNTDINPDLDGFIDQPNYIRTKDGVELWKQSRQGFYFKNVNADTAKYLQDVGVWDGDYGNVSAAQFIPRSKPADDPGPKKPVKTVTTGFQSIPETMIKQFLERSTKHKLEKNHHLKSIKKYGEDYILTFKPTHTVNGVTKDVEIGHYLNSEPRNTCAKKILLAVGRLSLATIDWDGLKPAEVQDYLHNSVVDVNAGKMYFASSNNWWADFDKTPHLTISDTPLRQTFDYAHSIATGKHVLNVGYMDSNTYVSFWRELKEQGVRYPGTTDYSAAVSKYTVDIARKFLAEIYNVTIDQIPIPTYAAMSLWDSYPYGAAWYSNMPGYDSDKVKAKMLRPSPNDDVFIPSNTFSGLSIWVEGALQAVELVLKHFQS